MKLLDFLQTKEKKKITVRTELSRNYTRLSDNGISNCLGLKKNLVLSSQEKLILIERDNSDISIARQAELLDISRSSIYYQPKTNSEDVLIMNAIDEIFTECPFYGHRRIRKELADKNIKIGKKRTRSLMKKMGLQAIYPKKKPNTSASNDAHKKFPYLLKDLEIAFPNHVWGTDITYIRLKCGFVYLTVIIDWFSRYIISWRLSVTMETSFCIESLNAALEINLPNIHNSDQGVQFTDRSYVGILEEKQIMISMDGRGRCMDNIFTERFWRTLKYENIYLNNYEDYAQAHEGIEKYIDFYNRRRKHQSLDYKTPEQIYLTK
jgi:putative transposase